jgi:hypothetical protein
MTQPVFQPDLLATVLQRVEHLELPLMVGVVLRRNPVRTNQRLILSSQEWSDRLEPRPPRLPTPAGEVFERLPPRLEVP